MQRTDGKVGRNGSAYPILKIQEKKVMIVSIIGECTCKSEKLDELFGKGKRALIRKGKDVWVCDNCGMVQGR